VINTSIVNILAIYLLTFKNIICSLFAVVVLQPTNRYKNRYVRDGNRYFISCLQLIVPRAE